jgi:cytoskeleton protein RodZ
MTEAETNPANSPASEPTSYGARLAAARQRAGLTVTDIAARLRLHPNQVRAIEQENLGALPEMAYVRGFVRSYARIVQLDADSLLADLNARTKPADGSVVDGMKADSYSPVKAAAQEQTSKRLVIGIAVLVLIVLGAIGWYANQQAREESLPAPAASAPPSGAMANAALTTVAASPSSAEYPTATSAADDVAPSEETPTEPPAADAGAPVVAPPEAAPAAVLRMTFSGPCWLQVVDGKGKVVLSGIQQAGAAHDLQGPLPMAVVIGDAAKASVEVRGDRFDLAPVTRSNVARFNVQ